MGPFFKDLKDERYETPFAIYHRRFSTNTVPKWPLAQPMRFLGHNGGGCSRSRSHPYPKYLLLRRPGWPTAPDPRGCALLQPADSCSVRR